MKTNKKTELFKTIAITGIALFINFFTSAQTPNANGIIYVNINVSGGNGSGDSWANAIPQLADAMKYARGQYIANNTVYDTTPLKIYVAKGTYKPMYSPINSDYTQDAGMDNAFVMVKNVQIYGGFDPSNGINDLSDTRIFDENGSILSGDIGNTPQNQYDNTYHVVISSGNVGQALLDGFTIRDAFMDYYGSNGSILVNTYPVSKSYGAIYNVLSSPTYANCIIRNNVKWFAGGMYNYYQSSPTLINCSFKNNYTYYTYAGAMYNYYQSSPTITNCSFTNNSSLKGGAIYNTNNSSPVISNCSFTGNGANEGGAIYNNASSPVIINTLFANNSAQTIGNPTNGSIIYNEGTSSPSLTNVTIANNTGLNVIYATAGSTTINNSIVYGTISGTYVPQYSLIEGNTDFTNGNIDASSYSLTNIFNIPSSGDYTLKNTSPAINTGNNALFPNLDINTKDIIGNSRVLKYNNSGIIDMGAYESLYVPIVPTNGIVYVKQSGTGEMDGSSWANATSNLQDAIDGTNVQKVYVAVGNYPVGSFSFRMKNGVEIYGGFDPDNGITTLADARILPTELIAGSVLNGQNAKPIILNDNNGASNTALLDGFTLTNGRSTTGGGIYNNGASPTLKNLWIKANTATADGGGMYNVNSSSPIISNVTLSGNTANYAGGIFNRSSSSPVMTNVVIKANSANNDGGAMYNDVSASPVMTNVSITANSAQNGAGMYNRTNSSPVITNSLIANNTATTNGGAIRNEATSSPTLTNVTIANNSGTTTLYATNGSTTLSNSIIYGTVSGAYTPKYSLIQGNLDLTNGNIDATGITVTDIFTSPSAGNYTLKSGSIAINAGNNALFTGLDANTKDLAGNPRLNGAAIDLGAYEYQSGTLSTGNLEAKDVIEIYPNPFTDILRISDIKGIKFISLHDSSGRLIKKLAPSKELNLSGLSQGVYLLVLKMENSEVKTFKVIKK